MSTGRTVRPGERVSLRCKAFDRHGRDLHWWLHQYDGSRHSPVVGDDVVLTWDVDAAAIGESVYVGIGMAADTHYHRQGGRMSRAMTGLRVGGGRFLREWAGSTGTGRSRR